MRVLSILGLVLILIDLVPPGPLRDTSTSTGTTTTSDTAEAVDTCVPRRNSESRPRNHRRP